MRGELRDAPSSRCLAGGIRKQIICLARAGQTSKVSPKEFVPSEHIIRRWTFRAEVDPVERPDAQTTARREKLTRLPCENRELKVERDISGKAAASFARESGTIPLESSAS